MTESNFKHENNKIYTLLVLFFIISVTKIFSQNDSLLSQCGNNKIFSIIDFNPILNANLIPHKQINNISYRTNPIIPVVVHIVWNNQSENISDERVLSQIQALNRDFNAKNEDISEVPDEFKSFISNSGVMFCLAAISPQGIYTSGITRTRTDITEIGIKKELFRTGLGGCDAWDTRRYFNIWVANTGKHLTGFGIYPEMADSIKDGIVVNPNYFGIMNGSERYNKGRVAVHETGHYLGLRHTWNDDEDCNTDDGISDTPLQLSRYTGCPSYPQYSCGISNMFMNFMDYVDDDCMYFFTQGQMSAMLSNLNFYRSKLLTNKIACENQLTSSVKQFTIIPNPATDHIEIQFSTPVHSLEETALYNDIGQVIFNSKKLVYNSMVFEIPSLPKGIYLLKIGSMINKFIIM